MDTSWLSNPNGRHLALRNDSDPLADSPWSVVLMVEAVEGDRCHNPLGEHAARTGEMMALPPDGQGDAVCLSCALRYAVEAVTVSPQQAADLEWWNDAPAVSVVVEVTPA